MVARRRPKPSGGQSLPKWKVVLHNDTRNSIEKVIAAIKNIVRFSFDEAKVKAEEAHNNGRAILLETHKEKAELYQENFKEESIKVTLEPGDR